MSECFFTLKVTGPDIDLDIWKQEIESHTRKEVEEAPEDELFASMACYPIVRYVIDLEYWGDTHQQYIWASPADWNAKTNDPVEVVNGPVYRVPGKAVISGEVASFPPLPFMELTSKKYPSLTFECVSTVPDFAFDHWIAKDGKLFEVEYKHYDETGYVYEWRKDGIEMSQEELEAYHEEHLIGDRWADERSRREVVPLEEQAHEYFVRRDLAARG